MQYGFQILPLPRVLGIKQIKQFENKGVVNISFCDFRIRIGGNHVSEEKLVDELKVRPGRIQAWFLLFRIGGFLAGVLVRRRREAPENIDGDHSDHLLLAILRHLAGARLDEVDEVHQRLALDFLLSNVLQRVGEVKDVAADVELPEEEVLPVRGRRIAKRRQRLHGPGGRHERHRGAGARRRGTSGSARGVVDDDIGRGRRCRVAVGGGVRRKHGIACLGLGGLLVPAFHDFLEHSGVARRKP